MYWPGVYWPSRKVSLSIYCTVVVQSLSCVHGCQALQASPSFTITQSLHKPMPIDSVMPSNHLILYQPLLLLPSIFPSIRVFSNEAVLHIRWPKYWSFNFSISSSNEYSGLTLGLTDWISWQSRGLSRVHSGYPTVKSSTLYKWYNHYTPGSHLIVSTVELSAWRSETPRKGMLLGTA